MNKNIYKINYHHYGGTDKTVDPKTTKTVDPKTAKFVDLTVESSKPTNSILRVRSLEPTNLINTNSIKIDVLRDLLKNQIDQYVNALKKIETKTSDSKSIKHEKIKDTDILFSDNQDYINLKEKFENGEKNYKDKEFYQHISNLFKDQVPMIKMYQRISKNSFNNYGYQAAFNDNIFYNGKFGEHWYLLPREFNDRFNPVYNTNNDTIDMRNIFRLNRYLGLQPFQDIKFSPTDIDGEVKLIDQVYFHEVYVFINYLCKPITNFNDIFDDKEATRINTYLQENKYLIKMEANNQKFKESINKKYQDVSLKCFCNFLLSKFEFNNKIDGFFNDFDKARKDTKLEKMSRIVKLLENINDIIENYALWDFIMWSLPWTGNGRTFDYGESIDSKGGSEFHIPKGEYLNSNFTPILTNKIRTIKYEPTINKLKG